MAPLTIDDKEYDSENLSDKSKQYIANIQFIKSETAKLESQIKVYKIAEATMAKALKDSLEN
tara:strand:- start:621 stop:806 length:186 start_codon:yes stop_codon:yes gene_type:complete